MQHSDATAAAANELVAKRGAGRNVRCATPDAAALSRAILARSRHSGKELLILLCVAAFTQEGDETWSISVARIAELCKFKKRAIQSGLAALRSSGELVVAKRGGGKVGPNFYAFAPFFYEGLQ